MFRGLGSTVLVTDTSLTEHRKASAWQRSSPPKFARSTGSILPGNGAEIPTYPSSESGLKKTVLLMLFPKIHCHTPPSFSGR
uniref:Uncharacterized protein n=1 Tax=Arundo donax TaxID=35708 RepID=A0A0A9ERH7_ARUDO